ncbi:hypothetical protein AHAS_Ahas14G0138500 [Arachis hypogaea]
MRDNSRNDDGGSKQKQNQLKKPPLKKTKTVAASSTTHLRVSVENAIAVEEQCNFPSFHPSSVPSSPSLPPFFRENLQNSSKSISNYES